MSACGAILERLLMDCECVTVGLIAQELLVDVRNVVEELLEYAQSKELQVIYSVCYTDNDGSVILSHKTTKELEELENKCQDVRKQLFGVRKRGADAGTPVTQMCWKHEVQLVEDQLNKSCEQGDLYIPSSIALKMPSIRTRKYERVKQGLAFACTGFTLRSDSAVCAPTPKPVIITGPKSVSSPIRRIQEASKASTSSESQSNTVASARGNTVKKKSTLQQQSIFGALSKEPKPQKTSVPITKESEPTEHPKTLEAITTSDEGYVIPHESNKRASPSVKPVLSQEEQRQAKREKVTDDTEIPEPPTEENVDSLFDCDEPLDAMDLDAPNCNDDPVTYIEKVTKDITYVESGYYVAEETSEYEEVTAPARSQASVPSRVSVLAQGSRGNEKGLLKTPQQNMRQLSVTSFLKR